MVFFVSIRAVRPRPEAVSKPEPGKGFADEFRAGLAFFLGSRVLLTLTLGVIVATLGAGAINALNVFFVPHNLHVAASWLGTLTAGEGAGAIAGALVAQLASSLSMGGVRFPGEHGAARAAERTPGAPAAPGAPDASGAEPDQAVS